MKNEQKLADMMQEIQISEEQMESIMEACKSGRRNRKVWRFGRPAAVAAAAALFLLVSGGTVYAISQRSVIREFFLKEEQGTYAEELFDERNQSVTIGNVTYTVEGIVYGKDTGIGYLSIRMNREDGSAPEIDSVDTDISYRDQFDETMGSYRVDGTDITLVGEITGDGKNGSSIYTKRTQEEDGTYLYIKYKIDPDVSDNRIYILADADIEEAIQDQTVDELLAKSESISVLSDAGESKTVSNDRFTAVVNPINAKLSWEGDTPDTIRLYKKDGTSELLLLRGELVSKEDQWAGDTLLTDEEEGGTLYVSFENMIPLEEMDYIDVDGVKIQY